MTGKLLQDFLRKDNDMESVFMVVIDQGCPSETAKEGIKVRDEVISLLLMNYRRGARWSLQ